MSEDPLRALASELGGFAAERDWERFHTPKNLAMALAAEAGEVLELFQWLTPEEAAALSDGPRAGEVADELADVLLYLVRLADVCDVDLAGAAGAKLERNARRFPPERVRGRADVPPGDAHAASRAQTEDGS